MDDAPLRVLVLDSPEGALASLPDDLAGSDWFAMYETGWPPVSSRWRPDAIIVDAGLPGGPKGGYFSSLLAWIGSAPLLVGTRTRSLSQALDFFRAGAADYQPVPASPDEWLARLRDNIERRGRSVDNVPLVEAEELCAEEDVLAGLADPGYPDPG